MSLAVESQEGWCFKSSLFRIAESMSLSASILSALALATAMSLASRDCLGKSLASCEKLG